MIELTPFAGLLSAVGNFYLIVIGAAISIALWKGKTWPRKIGWALFCLALFLAPIVPSVYRGIDYRMRYAKAKAAFDERCKSAGETIYRTVRDVEGILVMRVRAKGTNLDDQFKLDDPYGYAGGGEDYLRLFIRGRPTIETRAGDLIDASQVVTYKFAEATDSNGDLFRYTTPMSKVDSERLSRNGGGVVPIEKTLIPAITARYGVGWSDISTKADRENWIAGSSLKLIDIRTNEVMGERIGYLFDPGLGDTSGGRSPWAMARQNACPPLNERNFYFFDRVIWPAVDNAR